ncbi:hypothetical protein RISK_005514 [Rhodopirellula islandica]|uniref:Uncharacterized protein n=1 Tax=Rhodopirellula islandica TaxID=595434 RepID=A0A0J1B799_RHOIS|nr:hypothetical protein RISK_005514 [Rhodopirellula islandica]
MGGAGRAGRVLNHLRMGFGLGDWSRARFELPPLVKLPRIVETARYDESC